MRCPGIGVDTSGDWCFFVLRFANRRLMRRRARNGGAAAAAAVGALVEGE